MMRSVVLIPCLPFLSLSLQEFSRKVFYKFKLSKVDGNFPKPLLPVCWCGRMGCACAYVCGVVAVCIGFVCLLLVFVFPWSTKYSRVYYSVLENECETNNDPWVCLCKGHIHFICKYFEHKTRT